MTVAELIEELQKLDPQLDIYCKSNEGRDLDLLRENPFYADKVFGAASAEEIVIMDLG